MPHALLASVPQEHHEEATRHLTKFDSVFKAESPQVRPLASAGAGQFMRGAAAAGIPWAQIITMLPTIAAMIQQIVNAFPKPGAADVSHT